MQVKDMFLKKNRYLHFFLIIIFLLFSYKPSLGSDDKNRTIKYLNSLKFFSASFLQDDGENLSEGKIYIGNNRVRAEYLSPVKILIILDEDKAMYYNYELEEDEFFNPKNTEAWFFYDIFRNPIFFKDSLIEIKKGQLTIEKKGGYDDGENFLIRVYFENNPLVLRGIDVFFNDGFLKLSIYNHNYYEEFDKNFFKLINPKLLN